MTDDPDSVLPRQRVVRVSGSRRAKLTPVAGTDVDPETSDAEEKPAPRPQGGPNDERLIQDIPPHY